MFEFSPGDFDELLLVLSPAAPTTLASVHSTPENVVQWWSGCCSALMYLHSKRIMHRDVKPANIGILYFPNARAVLLDLGSCEEKLTSDNHYAGTVRYLAPEVIRLKNWAQTSPRPPPYNHKVDIWGIGITFFEAIHRRVPWREVDKNQWEEYFKESREDSFLHQQIRWAGSWDAGSRPSAEQLSAAAKDYLDQDSNPKKRQRLA